MAGSTSQSPHCGAKLPTVIHTRLSRKHVAMLDVGSDTVTLSPVPMSSLGFAEGRQAQAPAQDGLSLVRKSRSGQRSKDSTTMSDLCVINAVRPQL